MADPLPTRPLSLTHVDAWSLHDVLTAALAGFSGWSETASPWHATNVLAKLRPLLLRFASRDAPAALTLELSQGELECIDLNLPRTAYQGAPALLVHVFHCLEEIATGFPLLTAEPDVRPQQERLAAWREQERE